jgi:23S rRNA (pseudouridine1915-N3)-methyltransferase
VKLRLIAVDKVREGYVAAAVADFRARLRRYESFDEIEVAASRGTDPERAVREEGERIVRALQPGDVLWLLEREGAQLSSPELAERLTALAAAGTARLVLALAGTYGASDALLARADFRWSLSRLTLLHEWARALVLEQLYRAAKIARNEPYHH